MFSSAPVSAMSHKIMARKPLAVLQAEAQPGQGMARQLGAWDLIFLGVGVIMGTGLFVITGHAAAANAGPSIAISFAVAGVAAGFAGLCYAEMASMIPVSGSAYTYAYATMGELAAFLIGWDLILEYLVGAATVTVGWSGYVVALVHRLTSIELSARWTSAPCSWDAEAGGLAWTGSYLNLPATLFALGITALLVLGIKHSARVNMYVVIFKLVAVAVFLCFAAPLVDTHNWRPFVPPNTGTFGKFGLSGVFQGATIVFFAYIGFDAISTVAQETRRPQRDLPIGMMVSLAVCTILYMAVSLVLTGVVHYTELSVPHPLAVGVARTGHLWLEVVVELGALAGLFSGALVMLLGQPRIFYAMARDGLFPAFAAKLHPVTQAPVVTTVLSGSLCALMGGVLPIGLLGELTSIGTLFAFVLVSLAVMIMRLRQPDLPRAFRLPGGPYLIPLVSAAISLGLMATATPSTLLRLLVWMAAGLVIYALYGVKHSRLRRGQDPQARAPGRAA